jgi:proteic killer suppression protein
MQNALWKQGVLLWCARFSRKPASQNLPLKQMRYWTIIGLVACSASRYNQRMIKHFKHKGLRLFFETGSKSGICPDHAVRLARQLRQLNDSRSAKEMNMPGWKLHLLAGEFADHWSVTVNGNWRMTFVFEGEDAILVDYQDYH